MTTTTGTSDVKSAGASTSNPLAPSTSLSDLQNGELHESYPNLTRTLSPGLIRRTSLDGGLPGRLSDLDLNRDPSTLIKEVEEREEIERERIDKIQTVIDEKILRDSSPEAKLGRQKMMIRAAWGEFVCTILFYTPIFGAIVNFHQRGYTKDQDGLFTLAVAFISGFQAIAISYAFSGVSGAHFNSAVSFALWLTGKLSNRKVCLYIFVQMFASIIGMSIISSMFGGDLHDAYAAVAVLPVCGNNCNNDEQGRIFATEFFLTFILTYVGFTVAFEDSEKQKKDSMSFKTISDSKGLTLYASTPQSKTGFAPFSIGFTIFSISLVSGVSGGAFNPGRMFGPAIFSGRFDYIWIYWLAQFIGSSSAGLLVKYTHRYGLQNSQKEEHGVTETVLKTEAALIDRSATAKTTERKKIDEANASNTSTTSHVHV